MIVGPAIVWETNSTTFVPKDRRATVGTLRRTGGDVMTTASTGASKVESARLRDLDGEQFEARYGCDRFTATVLTNRCRYVAAHMANQVRSHAFSPVIRDGSDLCAMVSGPAELGYAMAAVSETMPLFYGSIPDAVRIVIEEYGADDLEPGDVLIVNDYYRVGTHLNDACLMRPVFHDGRIVARRHRARALPRHGRHRDGRLRGDEAHHLGGRPAHPADAAVLEGQAGQVDAEAALRQHPPWASSASPTS